MNIECVKALIYTLNFAEWHVEHTIGLGIEIVRDFITLMIYSSLNWIYLNCCLFCQ